MLPKPFSCINIFKGKAKEPKPTDSCVAVLRALYDYNARVEDDLSFRKGDKLELIGDRSGSVLTFITLVIP